LLPYYNSRADYNHRGACRLGSSSSSNSSWLVTVHSGLTNRKCVPIFLHLDCKMIAKQRARTRGIARGIRAKNWIRNQSGAHAFAFICRDKWSRKV